MSILVIIGIIIVGLCIYGYKQEDGGTEAYESGRTKTHWTSKLAFWLFILLVVNAFTGYAIIPNDISLSITK